MASKYKEDEISGGLAADEKSGLGKRNVPLAPTGGKLKKQKPNVEGHSHPHLHEMASRVTHSSEHEPHMHRGFHGNSKE